MDLSKTIEIQKQIRENSANIQNYFKDLSEWQKEINTKDKIIDTNFKQKDPKLYNTIEASKTETQIESTVNKNAEIKERLKRDVNSVKDYYNHWDKFDVDAEVELIDKDGKGLQNSKLSKMIKSETSKAAKNSSVVITNNRILKSDSEDYIEKLKNEANAYFAIKNFNKSIELYNSALELIDKDKTGRYDKLKLVIYNNKGNAYLKQNLFKEAIINFNTVLSLDSRNTKALFRRGHCYMRLDQFNLAYNDFQLAKESGKTADENEMKLIQENIEQCIKDINSVILKEKRRMEKFEHDDRTKFKKVKIMEICSEDFKDGFVKESLTNNSHNNATNNSIIANAKTKENNSETKKVTYKEPKISNEEITKFIYDYTKENLTASSFKFALRNFKSSQEKIEFLKVNFLS
jgi:tetratricopeptide (TPR) repeat protein